MSCRPAAAGMSVMAISRLSVPAAGFEAWKPSSMMISMNISSPTILCLFIAIEKIFSARA